MKRIVITTVATCLVMLLLFCILFSAGKESPRMGVVKVGFVFENDESAPYTYNFNIARRALERTYGDRVEIHSKYNVMETDTAEMLEELIVNRDCSIVFINNYSEEVIDTARAYPQVQFCQVSYRDYSGLDLPSNYHTFNGEIYQGRYVSGIAAGLKLREMIDTHSISASEALVGFVGAFSTPEVISGFTAFLLGVRSVAPEATMRVRYTGTWCSYSLEKACAQALIDEGCIVIAQHTDTIGPAIACEESAEKQKVFHIGYNQNVIDVAPTTSLISTRVNWIPYVTGAMEAVFAGEAIEKHLGGSVHGNDISAGFESEWVQMLELNKRIAAYETEERIARAIEGFKRGSIDVFKGDYTGVDPDDPTDTIDLRAGFVECENASSPSFHYILNDVITIED